MKKKWGYQVIFLIFLCPFMGHAQKEVDEKGFELGFLHFEPTLRGIGAYDDRVVIDGSQADGDLYGEAEVSLRLENTEARYDVGGWASYGYRAYDTYSGLNDDFYGAGANFASREGRLKSGISTYFEKTLDYDVRVDGDRELGAILTSSTSERASARVDVGYERQVTDKSAILPTYDGSYYIQNFVEQPDEEWQEHRAGLIYGYAMSPRMLVTLNGGYELQINDLEDGAIADVSIGAQSRATDKLEWGAELGVSSADYELSGTDEGFIGSLNLNWQASDKISVYVFGDSGYQPGQGGAQKVFRAGYGAAWSIVEKVNLNLQILHDYQEDLQADSGGSANDLDDIRHFVTGEANYELTRNIMLGLAGQYINDDEEMDQIVISGRIVWSY